NLDRLTVFRLWSCNLQTAVGSQSHLVAGTVGVTCRRTGWAGWVTRNRDQVLTVGRQHVEVDETGAGAGTCATNFGCSTGDGHGTGTATDRRRCTIVIEFVLINCVYDGI